MAFSEIPEISIGQELEYILIKGRSKTELRHFPDLIAPRVSRTVYASKTYEYSNPKIYVDGGVLEIASSVHYDIASLYEEMAELDGYLRKVCEEEGYRICSSAYNSRKKYSSIAANQVCIVSSNWVRELFSFGDYRDFDYEDLHAALCAYIPLFVTLTNNSPQAKFPLGSARLRGGEYSSSYFHENSYGKPIRWNINSEVLEIRAMDKGDCVEKDVAAAAVILATVRYLHTVNFKRDVLPFTHTCLEGKAAVQSKNMYGLELQDVLNISMTHGVRAFQWELDSLFRDIEPYYGDVPAAVMAVIDSWRSF